MKTMTLYTALVGAVMALTLPACSNKEAKARAALQAQATEINADLDEQISSNLFITDQATAAFTDSAFCIDIALRDSVFDIKEYDRALIDYAAAYYLKAYEGGAAESFINNICAGAVPVQLNLTDIYRHSATFDYSGEQLKTLFKSQPSALNPGAAKESLAKVFNDAGIYYMADGVTAVDFDFVTGFATYTITFKSPTYYAHYTPANIKARYLKPIAARYSRLNSYHGHTIDILHSLGIDGYRIIFTGTGDDAKTIKATMPWREIQEALAEL